MPASVLVTGASSGIGETTARRLAVRGFRVFGTSRSVRDDRDGVRFLVLDVGDESSVRKAVDQVVAEAGRIDALVCNAGMGIFGSVEEVDLAAAAAQFDTNFFGVLRCVRAVLPHLREQGQGRVVLVGSLAGRAPIPFQSHYSASKAAVEALALSLYNEVHAFGVHVSLVEPGDIQTPFNDDLDYGDSSASPYAATRARCEEVVRESLPQAPGPDVVARAVERALTDVRPRVRYSVGPDSITVPLGRRLLPDRWVLGLIRRHFRV